MKKNKDIKVSLRLESDIINDLIKLTNDVNVSNAIRTALKSYINQTKIDAPTTLKGRGF